jgi:hypothetical protein
MLNAIREGGWPMFIVLAVGVTSLTAAFRYSRDGRKDLLGLVLGLGAATLFAGLFGTVVGVMVSVEHVGELPPDQRWIVLLGLKESLNNLALATVFAFADALLVARGQWRRGRLTPPEAAART